MPFLFIVAIQHSLAFCNSIMKSLALLQNSGSSFDGTSSSSSSGGGGASTMGIGASQELVPYDADNHQGILSKLQKQRDYYRSTAMDEEDRLFKSNFSVYLRESFRTLKFFSDDKATFKEPDFVTEEGRQGQTADFCIGLYEDITGNEDASYMDYVRFWKTYRKIVKEIMNKMKHSSINNFKGRFVKGKLNIYV